MIERGKGNGCGESIVLSLNFVCAISLFIYIFWLSRFFIFYLFNFSVSVYHLRYMYNVFVSNPLPLALISYENNIIISSHITWSYIIKPLLYLITLHYKLFSRTYIYEVRLTLYLWYGFSIIKCISNTCIN